MNNEETDGLIGAGNIILIDELQDHGINASDITKLKAAGVYSISTVLATTRRNLCKIRGLSETKVEKIKEAANKIMKTGFIPASIQADIRKRVIKISTGCKAFDEMLGGGISTMSTTEVFGEFRTGKTQLAHTLCVTAQLPKEMGGAEGKVAYIDTEGTFRPERIREIAARFDIDGDTCLNNISYVRALNSEHQNELVEQLGQYLSEGGYKLIIVDSIIALFRVDYSGRGELGERQQKLNQHLSRLGRLSEDFNLAVLLTNQVQSDPGASALFASADGRKPVGGHILAHASQTRILLRKGRGEERVAKIQDSPDCKENECTYCLGAGGILDSSGI
ncbi:unnamed protein product [Ambrosiozyma monospora]|uniref:Unnamed protein product n=1 Tax=Ambrosiozyma monospora TaxID=43982 RepID=A0A9W6YYJ0_AMBMO|nr:unnamed protein product [Ambrosiozyma monospora]